MHVEQFSHCLLYSLNYVSETEKIPPARIALSFIVVPNELNVEYNASARLSCQAKGYPEAQLRYFFNATRHRLPNIR